MLISLSHDERSNVQTGVAIALGDIGDDRATDTLITLLSTCPISAAEALGKIKDPRSVQPLSILLKNPTSNNYVRMAAVSSLGLIADLRAFDTLIFALQDQEYGVRAEAIQALANLGDPQAVEPIIGLLTDKETDVQKTAAEALGNFKDQRALLPLQALSRDETTASWVRKAAAQSCDKITGKQQGIRGQISP